MSTLHQPERYPPSSISLPHADIVFPPHGSSDESSSRSVSPAVEEGSSVGGHHTARVGDTFKSGRYRVLARLGSGHFSTVWLCFDSQRRARSESSEDATGAAVAVKIQKSAERYTEAALDEIQLLRDVRTSDPNGEEAVVSLIDSFAHSGPNGRHMCLVFDVLGLSLLSLIKRFRYRGVPMPLVRTIARDLLGGLHFLHESAGIIHTDLKPENILMFPSSEDYRVINEQAALYARHLCERKGQPRSTSVRTERGHGAGKSSTNFADGLGDAKRIGKNQRKRAKAKARRAKQKEEARLESPEDEIDVLLREGDLRIDTCETGKPKSRALSPSSGATSDVEKPLLSAAAPRDMLKGASKVVDGNGMNDTRGSACDGGIGVASIEPCTEVDVVGDVRAVDSSVGHNTGPSSTTPVSTTPVAVTSAEMAPEEGLRAIWRGGPFVIGDFMDSDNLFRRGKVRIIDLGNACSVSNVSTGVIQTRQYRSPEVITGGRFGTSADMWSVACLLFELATGEFLFDPHGGRDFDRDEDHLAQMIELLGPMPRYVSSRGAYAHELFNRHGELRHIRSLSFWSLDRVLHEKYEFSYAAAEEFGNFLQMMLNFDPATRSTAAECLQHRFLENDSR